MPAIRAPACRAQHYFSPLTVRTTFRQERLSAPPPLAYHLVYPVGNHTPQNKFADPFAYNGSKPKALLKKKPDGEVTRINRGGYNLQAELKWTDDFYQACQKTLAKIADSLLDVSKTWPEQTNTKKKEFMKSAIQEVPILAEYIDSWPAADFMTVHLKNTKQRVTKTSKKGKAKADDRVIESEDEGST